MPGRDPLIGVNAVSAIDTALAPGTVGFFPILKPFKKRGIQ
jgi:hypothetical protein